MDVELTESWLSTETGVSRSLLRSIREKKLSAADWRKGSNGKIVWELTGLDKGSAEVPEFAGIIEKIKGGIQGAQKALAGLTPVEAVVTRKFRNPKLIEARLGSDERIMVRVHSSENFVPNMKIKALEPKVSGSPWLLHGKCPRWRGRF